MADICEYLDWRGDLTFSAAPFCEVDNLILSMLSFIDFSPALTSDPTGTPVKLKDCRAAIDEKYPDGMYLGEVVPKQINRLFHKAAESVRFRDVYTTCFRDVIREADVTQFAAVTFVLPDPDSTVFAAFRGTDDTLVGWREDFRLSYSHPVEAQRLAVEYLADVASVFRGRLMTGGHSKGGNLAVYAAAFSPKEVRGRVAAAYSNDGPGFLSEIISSEEFREIEPRVTTFVPQSSVVGLLLGHNDRYQVIESGTANGLMQHDPFSWKVSGPSFVHLDELSADGKRHDEAFSEWLDGISPEDRRSFTDTLFTILESTGAKTVTDLANDRMGKIAAAVKAYAGLEKSARDNFVLFLRRLADANRRAKP